MRPFFFKYILIFKGLILNRFINFLKNVTRPPKQVSYLKPRNIRSMRRNIIVLLLLMQVQVLSACHYKTGLQDTGALVHQVRNVEGFKGIEVSTGVAVYLSQGSTEHVEVVCSEKSMPQLKTIVEDGILKIYFNQHSTGFNWFSKHTNRVLKVYVTAKTLESLSASSGSDLYGQTRISSPKLDLHSSSGAEIRLDLQTADLKCEVSSGAGVQLKGTATHFMGSASSGAGIKALDLVTDSSDVSASSGGDIKLTVNKNLKAEASSGGDISYKGNPGSVSRDKSSGGSIHQN